MRAILLAELERYRTPHPIIGNSPFGENYGYFEIHQPLGILRIISSGSGPDVSWEHVSVSLASRCPTWTEMQMVKELFWGDEETVIQFHPQKSAYINRHEFCLHLWKQRGVNHPLPPKELIG